MIFIDSDIATDVLRKHPPALAWLGSVSAEVVVISGYGALELYAGCRDSAGQRAVDAMLARFEIAWPSVGHCEAALKNFRSLHLSQGIGALDILIGETAIEWGLPLHTFNLKHFRHVPGLTIIQPYTR